MQHVALAILIFLAGSSCLLQAADLLIRSLSFDEHGASNYDYFPLSDVQKQKIPAQPNIVVIMVDDMSVDLLQAGLASGYWPNLTNLVISRGANFQNFNVDTAVCCASRATFLTGQKAINTGVLANFAPIGSVSNFQDQTSMVVALHNAGYHTVHVGKYLNGYGAGGSSGPTSPTYVPPGYDYFCAPDDPGTYGQRGYVMNCNGVLTGPYGNAQTSGTDAQYQTYYEGKLFSQELAKISQPFFAIFTPCNPHHEIIPGVTQSNTLADSFALNIRPPARHNGSTHLSLPGWTDFNSPIINPNAWEAAWGTMSATDISNVSFQWNSMLQASMAIDDMIGSIAKAIQQRGASGNTLYIFTSDNGWMYGQYAMSQKYYATLPSRMVPTYFAGPGIYRGIIGNPSLNTDFAPTILALAGNVPSLLTMDGTSLIPALTKPSTAPVRNKMGVYHWQDVCTTMASLTTGSPMSDPDKLVPNDGLMVPGSYMLDGDTMSVQLRYETRDKKGRVHTNSFTACSVYEFPSFQGVITFNTPPGPSANFMYLDYGTAGIPELYDYSTDPNGNINVAQQSQYASTVQALIPWMNSLATCKGNNFNDPKSCASLEFSTSTTPPQ